MKRREPVIVMLLIVAMLVCVAVGLAYAIPRIVQAIGEAMG